MTVSEHIAPTDIAFRPHGHGDRAVIFVHGFLDDQFVWDKVIAELEAPGFQSVQLDLAGMGDRAGATGPFTYERFAADVGFVVDTIGKPFVIVGQSMGAPVAELVAADRPGMALGLVLLAPVPLAGTRLPDEAVAPFRTLGRDLMRQRALRRQLSVGLPDTDLERLVRVSATVRPQVVRALVDSWNAGLPGGGARSGYRGPALIVRGAGDRFVTEDLVAAEVSSRFASVDTLAIEGAGHWPHLERPSVVAARLGQFLAQIVRDDERITAAAVGPQGWTDAFARKSAERFGAACADDVVLEAANLMRPVEGREQVMRLMETASGIYESLRFTHEASRGPRSYLEWEATALGGLELRGVTILVKDERGKIVKVAIHHRPLGASLRFSAELRKRLTGVLDPGYFHNGDLSGTC
jgi:pimeloyl-ACP methyl ester carboxylesterase